MHRDKIENEQSVYSVYYRPPACRYEQARRHHAVKIPNENSKSEWKEERAILHGYSANRDKFIHIIK